MKSKARSGGILIIYPKVIINYAMLKMFSQSDSPLSEK